MNKAVSSPAEAVADIVDGATIGIAGFGVAHRVPSSLITALRDRGSQGAHRLLQRPRPARPPDRAPARRLGADRAPRHLLVRRPGVVSEAERAIQSGRMTLEMVPQGTLVERMRAGGAGLAAIYTPVSVGTPVAEGEEAARAWATRSPGTYVVSIADGFEYGRLYNHARFGEVLEEDGI